MNCLYHRKSAEFQVLKKCKKNTFANIFAKLYKYRKKWYNFIGDENDNKRNVFK